MPTVTLNKTVFEELVGKKLSLDELKDRISTLGTDLESIEDDKITVEIFPNRPDLLSEQGFARAFSSFIGVKTGLRKYNVQKSGHTVIVDRSVAMRPYTACAIVKNLTFTDERIREIMQMQEKLATTHGRSRKKSAYGVYPLKNISFPITYIAKDPRTVMFQPLGFDKKIPANQVEELHPTGQKFKHIASGWEKNPFFIDAKSNVMCMLPYTNSDDTGKVELTTKEVFIECTGNDFQNVTKALNMFVTMFAEMGGQIYSLDIKYPDKIVTTPDLTAKQMKLDLSYINQRLGLSLSEKKAQELLEKMGYGYEKGDVLIPSYRADILHQVDLMEDIAIAYGYENFEEVIPNVSTIGKEDPFDVFCRRVREILVGALLLEVKNYHLMMKDELREKMDVSLEPVALINALGEHNHLRNQVLPSLMKNLKDNQHHEYPQNLFEIGRAFTEGDSETGIIEREKLAVVLCHEKTDFTELKQSLAGCMSSLGLRVSIKEVSHSSFIEGRVGEMYVQGKNVGLIGELSPQVIMNWSLAVPVVGMEMDLEELFSFLK